MIKENIRTNILNFRVAGINPAALLIIIHNQILQNSF